MVAAVIVQPLPGMAAHMSSGSFKMPQSVISGGGGESNSASYKMTGTLGQSVVGESIAVDKIVVGGFWNKDIIDDTAPILTTLASGMYTTAQSITIVCSDGGGSGCSAIYYSTDGSDPSIPYTEPIVLSSDTTVRFIGVDIAGNLSEASNKTYTFDLDGDNMLDSWEVANFGGTSATVTADADVDGFTNLQEYLLGSDPNTDNADMTDTDGDGVPDAVETASGTDPNTYDLFEDPDNDGLTNGEEYLMATNASVDNSTMTDSDADGIPDIVEAIAGLSGDNSATDGDSDGITDLVEYKNGTLYVSNSALDDSDSDGLPDIWEMANGLDPLKDDSAAYTDSYNAGATPMSNLPPTPVVVTTINGSSFGISDTITIQFEASSDPEGATPSYSATLVEGIGNGGAELDAMGSLAPGSGYSPVITGGFQPDTIYTAIIRAYDGNAYSPATLVSFVITDAALLGGDINYSGNVDGYDLILLSVVFGKRSTHPTFNPFADMVDDNIIDGDDLGVLAPNFGKHRP